MTTNDKTLERLNAEISYFDNMLSDLLILKKNYLEKKISGIDTIDKLNKLIGVN